MKHIALVLTFAATLAATGQSAVAQDAKAELAKVIAVEEQERDLGKAETMYREAIAGGKVSEEAKRLAQQRLAALLQKLGRNEEAAALLKQAGTGAVAGLDDVTATQGQDAAREAELREKAKVLVQQVIEDRNRTMDAAGLLLGMRQATAEQMLWIGQAGVPVVIAALEDIAKADKYDPKVVASLGGFLWRVGGPQAAEFLQKWAKQGAAGMRASVVLTAYQANRPEMLATAEAFLDDPDPQITFRMLRCSDQDEGQLAFRLDRAVILAMAERGSAAHKAFVLDWAVGLTGVDAGIARRVVLLMRQGFASTDPAFGAAARKCLESHAVQACVEGVELLLGEAPKLRDAPLQRDGAPLDAGTQRDKTTPVEVSSEVGKRLWPQVVACIRALGEDHPQRGWVKFVANWVLPGVGPDSVPELLALVDAGIAQRFGLQEWLPGFVTAENAVAVLSRYERLGGVDSRSRFLTRFRWGKLPRDAFFVLLEKAELQRREMPEQDLEAFVWPMVRTGHPDAADWITAEWQRRTDDPKWAVEPLLELGRVSQDDKVRVAMHTLLGSERLSEDNKGPLLFALLSMHDVPALEVVVGGKLNAKVIASPNVHALDYLLQADPKPPHGFTEDDVFKLLPRLAEHEQLRYIDWRSLALMAPRIHGEVVRLQLLEIPSQDVNYQNGLPLMLVNTVLDRARTPEGQKSSLRIWAAEMLKRDSILIRKAVLTHLEKSDLEPQRALVESFLDGDDEGLAVLAATRLTWTKLLLDPARFAKNRYPGVRELAIVQWRSMGKKEGDEFLLPLLRDPDAGVRMEAAEFFGARVSKEAVPDLIALLRDPEEVVRKEAADALTRIRFFHEQQAHWDRVLKGLDASSTSAVEKLLLQAKPGAPREQRLLAITSLGTLGVPEALPFLIDWTADADAELAAAAKASITQIHLNPKR
jgi:hypothetical protein